LVRNPREAKPARPVPAAEHRHSGCYREKAEEENPDRLVIDWILRVEPDRVIEKAGDPGHDKHTAYNGHGVRAFAQWVWALGARHRSPH
jgi:hypothetical protein